MSVSDVGGQTWAVTVPVATVLKDILVVSDGWIVQNLPYYISHILVDSLRCPVSRGWQVGL